MRHAKSTRWVVILGLAVLITAPAIWYAKRTLLTEAPPTSPPERTLTREAMVESILEQATVRENRRVTADTAAMWVRVANRTPISNANRRYLPRETCFIQDGERATLIRRENHQLLLRYFPRLPPDGSNCPDGTLFFVTAESKTTRPAVNGK